MIDITMLSPADLERFIHLQSIIDRQKEAATVVKNCRKFYDGDHPVVLSERQIEYLGEELTNGSFAFSHNVVADIVDTHVGRLELSGFSVNGVTAGDKNNPYLSGVAETIWQWWKTNRMPTRQSDLYTAAIRDGKAYVIVDYSADTGSPRWTIHEVDDGSDGVVLHRDPGQKDRPLYASRYWREYNPLEAGKTGTERKTVYLPGEVRKYIRATGATPLSTIDQWKQRMDEGDQSWPLPWIDMSGAPLGVTVFEFRAPGGSEIVRVGGFQNALNKSWLDLFAAADAAGFPVMAIEYNDALPREPGNDDDDDLSGDDEFKIAPGQAAEIEGGRLHRIEPANLDSMMEVIWNIVNAMAISSKIPQHELRPLRGIQVPAEGTLRQMEASLVKKAERNQTHFGQAWSDVVEMSIKVQNTFGTPITNGEKLIIDALWASAGTRAEREDAEVAKIHKELGVPDPAVWAYLGYTPETIAKFLSTSKAS